MNDIPDRKMTDLEKRKLAYTEALEQLRLQVLANSRHVTLCTHVEF
jgi:hypothetical protein